MRPSGRRIFTPSKSIRMQNFWPVLLRTLVVFAVLLGLQFLIHYYVLVAAGIIAGAFMLKTSDDKPLAWGILIGCILFGVYAFFFGKV